MGHKSRTRRVAEFGVAFSAAAAISTGWTPKAFADHGDGMPDPDGRHHEKEWIDTTAGTGACKWGNGVLGNRTNIEDWDGGEDTSCYDEIYNAPWFGQATCTNANWLNITCFDSEVQFDNADAADNDTFAWKYIGCHEFGHIAGMGHQAAGNSCMVDASGNINLDDHDVEMVNRDVP